MFRRRRRVIPRRALLGAAIALAMLAAPPARAADTSDPPILRIETGVHMTVVLGLAVSHDGKRLATASNDTTVRLWSLPDLQPQRTIIHLPIGAGIEGAAYAVAFSPDGATLLATGATGRWGNSDNPFCIYIIGATDGKIRGTKCDLPAAATQLGFSPDGKFLAVTLNGKGGLRIYRSADFSLFKADTDYAGPTMSFDFAKDGRIVTASLDGHVRLYDRNFNRIGPPQPLPGGRKPHGLSFSPDGKEIAVGYAEPEVGDPPWTPAVDVLRASDLKVAFRPDVKGVTSPYGGALWRVAWSADGKYLYAGGTWQKDQHFPVRRWGNGGRGAPQDFATSTSRIVRMERAPQGVLFSTEAGDVELIGANDQFLASQLSVIADTAEIGDQLAISPDAREVQFAFAPYGEKPAHFSLTQKVLASGNSPDAARLVHPLMTSPGLALTNWLWSYGPLLNGKPLEIEKHDQSLSAAFFPDGQGLLLGTSWELIRYDRNGAILWREPIYYSVRGIVVTPDSRLIVALIGDGTIRWYAADTGRELIALFPAADQHRWVAWTPQGYYMASAGGDTLIGWQVDHGHDQPADFYPVWQYAPQYERPDIVQQTLALRDEQQGIDAADAASGRAPATQRIEDTQHPVIEIAGPANGASITDTNLTLHFKVHSPLDAPITRIIARDPHEQYLDQQQLPVLDAKGDGEGDFRLIAPARDSELVLIAENRYGPSVPTTVALKWAGPAGAAPLESQHKLYVVAVGVSKYADTDLEMLSYPDKDAADFVAALQSQTGKAFTTVIPKILPNEEASLANILKTLDWLDDQVGPDDIGAVFLAGHGFNDKDGTFYYVPQDADMGRIADTGLPATKLVTALNRIAGYPILFIDTCYAASVAGKSLSTETDSLVNRLGHENKGIIVYAAASGEQESNESSLWQNGVFTHALVEEFDGKGDRDLITTTMLAAYVVRAVNDMTGIGPQHQDPRVNIPIGEPNLLMARSDGAQR
ncbi:MAG TPA: caspase family protein [Stellaceae bacterium]|jgi:WD40 repeat protein